MAITAVEWRQSVSFQYDLDVVKGEHAEVWAANPANDEELAPKKKIVNDGSGAVAFPEGYSGECLIEVRGSDEGVDSGVIVVAAWGGGSDE